MSSKFNPNLKRRQPPPQCKKSKPNPFAPSIIGPSPMIEGEPLYLSFIIEYFFQLGTQRVTFQSLIPMDPTGLWSGGAFQSVLNFVLVGVRYNFADNTFRVLAESKIGGLDFFTVNSQLFHWNGLRPFTFPMTWCDMEGFRADRVKRVTCGLTA